MTATYDPTTDAGRVRLLISDTDVDGPSLVFQDDEIATFLALEPQVFYAAATALDTIASNEALVSKKVQTRDGQATDGPAVAAELRARATQLRATADRLDDDFAFAEFVDSPFTFQERIVKQSMRNGF